MRKFIIGILAIAMLAIPSVASADVPRCEASVPVNTTSRPRRSRSPAEGHDQPVQQRVEARLTPSPSNADNTFTGTSTVTDNGGSVAWTESVTGTFNADKTLISFRHHSLVGWRRDVQGDATRRWTTSRWTVESTWTANEIEMKISAAGVHRRSDDDPRHRVRENHGQYVKAQGGGKDAAQACAGMPLNSTQGGK